MCNRKKGKGLNPSKLMKTIGLLTLLPFWGCSGLCLPIKSPGCEKNTGPFWIGKQPVFSCKIGKILKSTECQEDQDQVQDWKVSRHHNCVSTLHCGNSNEYPQHLWKRGAK